MHRLIIFTYIFFIYSWKCAIKAFCTLFLTIFLFRCNDPWNLIRLMNFLRKLTLNIPPTNADRFILVIVIFLVVYFLRYLVLLIIQPEQKHSVPDIYYKPFSIYFFVPILHPSKLQNPHFNSGRLIATVSTIYPLTYYLIFFLCMCIVKCNLCIK